MSRQHATSLVAAAAAAVFSLVFMGQMEAVNAGCDAPRAIYNPSTCRGNPRFIGNNYCNWENNNIECGWDGGDCCKDTCRQNYPVSYSCVNHDWWCRAEQTGCVKGNYNRKRHCTFVKRDGCGVCDKYIKPLTDFFGVSDFFGVEPGHVCEKCGYFDLGRDDIWSYAWYEWVSTPTHCASCKAGYRAKGSHDDGSRWCEDINECASKTCSNHGNCQNLVNAYKCQCHAGWTGTDCQTNINECAPNPCLNGGRCSDGIASYTCACPAGYAGSRCEVNINECARNECQHQSTCVDGINAYTCSCRSGFTGHRCQTNIDDCRADSCRNGGHCIDGVNAFTCQCESGFTGSRCEVNINDCRPDSCYNGGECVDGVNSFTCRCATGFTGERCQTNVNECVGHQCANGGQCVDGINAYTCRCPVGFTGTFCQTNIDDCAGRPCGAKGRCVDGVNAFTCECVSGWGGRLCDVNLDECESEKPDCGHGTCVDGDDKFTCACEAGWENDPATPAKFCSRNIDDCAKPDGSRHCNRGTCVDQLLSYRCECGDFFTGTQCETDVDECKLNTHGCPANSLCLNKEGGFDCVCKFGLTKNVSTGKCDDLVAPVITLARTAIAIDQYSTIPAAELTATDNLDGNLHGSVVVDNSAIPVNEAGVPHQPGTYTRTFRVSDAAGNAATQRSQQVTVAGVNECQLPASNAYSASRPAGGCSPNARCADTANLYTCTCLPAFADQSDGKGTMCADVTAPAASVVGADPLTLPAGSAYIELGCLATDVVDGGVACGVAAYPSGFPGVGATLSAVREWTIAYEARDAAGNVGRAERRLVVEDVDLCSGGDKTCGPNAICENKVGADFSCKCEAGFKGDGKSEAGCLDDLAPVLAVDGDNPARVTQFQAYSDAGATVTDSYALADGSKSAKVTTFAGAVDVNVVGEYTLTYNAVDRQGNAAEPVTRRVLVENADECALPSSSEHAPTCAAHATCADLNPGYHCPCDATWARDDGADAISGECKDVMGPTVTLKAQAGSADANEATLQEGGVWAEPGWTVTDNSWEGALDEASAPPSKVTVAVSGSTSTADKKLGSALVLTYQATDAAGNAGPAVERRIVVVNVNECTATDERAAVCQPDSTCFDIVGGGYDCECNDGLTLVQDDASPNGRGCADTTAPVLTLKGDDVLYLTQGSAFVEPGFTAADVVDGDLAAAVVGPVAGDDYDMDTINEYTLRYSVSDKAGNSVRRSRTLWVTDRNECAADESPCAASEDCANTSGSFECRCKSNFRRAAESAGGTCVDATVPTITLNGDLNVKLSQGAAWPADAGLEPAETLGAHVTDVNPLTDEEVTLGADRVTVQILLSTWKDGAWAFVSADAVETNAAATYQLVYTASDAAGNEAAQQVRYVTVNDVNECTLKTDSCDRATMTCENLVSSGAGAGYKCVCKANRRAAGGTALQPAECVDSVSPVVTLTAESPRVALTQFDAWSPQSVLTAEDLVGEDVQDVTADIRCTPALRNGEVGEQTVNCGVADAAGNEAEPVAVTLVFANFDECAAAASSPHAHDCFPAAACTDTESGYTCACPTGFEGEGVGADGCTDVNECAVEEDEVGPCGAAAVATCRNEPVGSYTCDCNSGFRPVTCAEGDPACRSACMDVDECTDDADLCSGTGIKCVNTAGSYECSCEPGYVKNEETGKCDDINDCADNKCHAGSECVDGIGSYTCKCGEGRIGEFCEKTVEEVKAEAEAAGGDTDDCDRSEDSPSCLNGGECLDLVDAFHCNCPDGFSGARCQCAADDQACREKDYAEQVAEVDASKGGDGKNGGGKGTTGDGDDSNSTLYIIIGVAGGVGAVCVIAIIGYLVKRNAASTGYLKGSGSSNPVLDDYVIDNEML